MKGRQIRQAVVAETPPPSFHPRVDGRAQAGGVSHIHPFAVRCDIDGFASAPVHMVAAEKQITCLAGCVRSGTIAVRGDDPFQDHIVDPESRPRGARRVEAEDIE